MRTLIFFLFLVVLISSPVWAQEIDPGTALNGLWLGGDAGDDKIRFVINFDSDPATMSRLRPGESSTADPETLRVSFDGTTHVTVIPLHEPDEKTYHLLLRTSDEAYFWEAGDDDIFNLWRVVEIPEGLRGEWILADPGSCFRDPVTVTITASTIDFAGTGAGPLELAGLASARDVVRVAYAEDAEDYTEIHELVRDPTGAWLVRELDDDDFIVFHRPGDSPLWLGCGDRPVDRSDICDQAAEKMMECLRAFCVDRVGINPMCDNLQQFEQEMVRVPDCTADMIPFAEEIMGATCEQIVGPYRQLE